MEPATPNLFDVINPATEDVHRAGEAEPAVLVARSREAQNKLSAELAEQVLGEFDDSCAPSTSQIRRAPVLAKSDPHHPVSTPRTAS
jgi:hypothetical protein